VLQSGVFLDVSVSDDRLTGPQGLLGNVTHRIDVVVQCDLLFNEKLALKD